MIILNGKNIKIILSLIFLFCLQEGQIKDTIKKFLDRANLEEVTMKTVCKKVYQTYPDFDLAHKKDFIKTTVKSVSL